MKRIIVAAVLAAGFASTAFATSVLAGPIEDRQNLMKGVQAATKDGVGLSRGTVPFDAAKAKATLQVYVDAGEKLPGLVPPGSETGSNTTASPKIWSDMAGFKAASAKFSADGKAAMSATDQASFAAGFAKITADCTACHGAYRVQK